MRAAGSTKFSMLHVLCNDLQCSRFTLLSSPACRVEPKHIANPQLRTAFGMAVSSSSESAGSVDTHKCL